MDILEYFKSDRSFQKGKELYNKHPKKSLAFSRILTRLNDTEENRSKLCYELSKLYGITERKMNIILRKPIEKKVCPTIEKVKNTNKTPENITTKTDNSKQENQSKTIREQFPFLTSENCPDVAKILVADLITAYAAYKKAHDQLFEGLKEDELFDAAADVIEPYIKNKQIFKELESYQKTGKWLGKYPKLEKEILIQELKQSSADDLAKEKENTERNIRRNDEKLKKADKSKKEKYAKKVIYYKEKLVLIEAELKSR
ncbi:hypothetical protein [Aureivirga marina]|uniref:hypothetical protein n=1 Tax=Aureivirga marina TaxID=1182451 RepID=UPI0018CB4D7A|nr:hypothetical protein [Aureivirga marina]